MPRPNGIITASAPVLGSSSNTVAIMDSSPLIRAGLDYCRRIHPFESPSLSLGVLINWGTTNLNDHVPPGGPGQPVHVDKETEQASPMTDPTELNLWRLRHARHKRGTQFLQLVPNWSEFSNLNCKQATSQVARGQSEARSNDVRTLRDMVQFKYTIRSATNDLLPIPQWGFMHEELGPILCPITWDWDDPSSQASLRRSGGKLENNLDLSAEEAPFCGLYDDFGVKASLPGGKITDGLMRSSLFISSLRVVSMGPSSAFKSAGDPSYCIAEGHSKSNAVLCQIEYLTAEFLAYLATVLRGALSNNNVAAHTPTFLYTRFFDVILDLLNRNTSATAELITFLNDHVVLANQEAPNSAHQHVGPSAVTTGTRSIAELRAVSR